MKKTIVFLLTAFFMMLGLSHATYIGSGDGNDEDKNNKPLIPRIDFSEDVQVGDNFNFDFVNKFDEVNDGGWPNTDSWSKDGVSIKAEEYKGSEITGVSFTIDQTKIEDGLEFISLKAGNGFVFFSIDAFNGDSFILNTEEYLGGKGISHISLWKGSGNISYPPGGDGGAQVPEPATIFLLGSGLLGLFGYKKKFWKSKTNLK